MNFLPDDYKAPNSNGSYTKLTNGVNKIRILTSPILGWEEWIDNKPIRYRMDEKPSKWNDPLRAGKHFWSLIIWNYQEEQIQILHLTQASIRKAIESLSKDSDWGEPFMYDIKITREGEGLKTKYGVNPLPHKEVDLQIKEAFELSPCNLDALFDGQDPFGEHSVYTCGKFGNLPEVKMCTKNEMAAFVDLWSLEYDKNLLNAYIESKAKVFDQDVKEVVYLLMQDQDKFEKEFKNWSSKQK